MDLPIFGTQSKMVSRRLKTVLVEGSMEMFGRHGARVTRFGTSRKAAASLALAGVMAVGATATASASVTLTNGGFASTFIVCSQALAWERETVTIRPISGLSSQSVAFREYIQPFGRTGFWLGWKGVTAPYSQTRVTNMSGDNFTVYMQYAWLRNGTWTYAGEWISSYGQTLGFGTTYMSYCAV